MNKKQIKKMVILISMISAITSNLYILGISSLISIILGIYYDRVYINNYSSFKNDFNKKNLFNLIPLGVGVGIILGFFNQVKLNTISILVLLTRIIIFESLVINILYKEIYFKNNITLTIIIVSLFAVLIFKSIPLIIVGFISSYIYHKYRTIFSTLIIVCLSLASTILSIHFGLLIVSFVLISFSVYKINKEKIELSPYTYYLSNHRLSAL